MKKLLVIAIICILVWLMAAYPYTMLNPGELVQGHQKEKNKCTSCHEPFWGISSEKCINCHKLNEIGIDSTRDNNEAILFHSNLKGQECTSCHTDHKGIKPSVSLSGFDHSFLSSADQEKCNSCHAKPADELHLLLSADCKSCHTTEAWTFTGVFDHNMIRGADQKNCSSCHRKPTDTFHEGLQNNCSECHSNDKWVPASFDHSSYFMLDRDHNTKCNTCHTNSSNFSIYTCYGCHEHSEVKIQEEHNEEGIYNFNNCTSCHRSSNKHDIRKDGKLDQKGVDELKKFIKSNEKGKKHKEKENED